MLLGLAIVETLVLHVIAIALWGRSVAILLGVADISLVLMLAGLLRSMRRYPVTIGNDILTMRVGRLRIIPIPLDRIAGLRTSWDAEALKAPGVANLALMTWPNIVVDLAVPVWAHGRAISAVAHKLDDPVGFAAALKRFS